jgi:glycosyltransferase involved in cell wall biosynthesis
MPLSASDRQGTGRIVHLTVREGLSNVFEPQVVVPMAHLKARGFDVLLLVFSALGDYLRPELVRRWRKLERSCNERGLTLQRLLCPPARAKNLWSESRLLARWLRKRARHEPVTLHCRGSVAAKLALAAAAGQPHVKIIFDCRGLAAAEFLYNRGYTTPDDAPVDLRRAAAAIESGERASARASSGVICVSEALKRYVVQQWGVLEERVVVVPCSTDTRSYISGAAARNETRQRHALSDRFVIVYSGSMASWQMPEESVELFARLHAIQPNLHFLCLTLQTERFTSLLRTRRIPDDSFTVLALSHDQMPTYLAAADCAMLVRETCLVNEVASPVKLAEYLAADLPVILSKGIGDYSEMVAREGLGSVLPRLPRQLGVSDFATVLADVDGVQAERCASVAKRQLDWSVAADAIERLWLELASPRPVLNGNIERKLDAAARAAG